MNSKLFTTGLLVGGLLLPIAGYAADYSKDQASKDQMP